MPAVKNKTLAKRINLDSILTERALVCDSFTETVEKMHMQDLYRIEKVLGDKESLFGVYFVYDEYDNDLNNDCIIIISITAKGKK